MRIIKFVAMFAALALTAFSSAKADGLGENDKPEGGDVFGIGYYAYPDALPVCVTDLSKITWDCAEKSAVQRMLWFDKQSQRIRTVADNLSWLTAGSVGCLLVIEERAGEKTSRACTFSALATLVYDDVTSIRYRKRLADEGYKAVAALNGRYARLRTQATQAAAFGQRAPIRPTGGQTCATINNAIASLKKLESKAATNLVVQELSELLEDCETQEALEQTLRTVDVSLANDGLLAQYYYRDADLTAGDIHRAMQDTGSNPIETFQITAGAPFAAVAKAIKGGASLEPYAAKRARSPDVFNFAFMKLPLPESLPPLSSRPKFRAGLSPVGEQALRDIAADKALLGKSLKPQQIRDIGSDMQILGSFLIQRYDNQLLWRTAVDGLITTNNDNGYVIDLRPKPVEGASVAKTEETKTPEPAASAK